MRLASYENLTKGKILFHEAKEYKVKESKLRYKRNKIETKHPDGKKHHFYLVLESQND